MKIFIDIGHPAHVHYFRNFINTMQSNGHVFLISARNRSIIHYLLKTYNIAYFNRGRGRNSLLGKILYMLVADYRILKRIRKFNPDLLMSFASPYAAHTAWMLRKPHIAFTDTDEAKLGIFSFLPFCKIVLTPKSFKKDFDKKHFRFNSFMELGYLAPKYFTPNSDILELMGVKKDEKYIIIRFVSWKAIHDFNECGFSVEDKIALVNELKKHAKVFISSEEELDGELNKYKLNVPPERMHDALAFAALQIGEGATTASECVMLGVPAIYVNSLNAGTLEEQSAYNLLYNYRNTEGVLDKALEILNDNKYEEIHKSSRLKLISEKIDLTAFMIWFVENYPDSIHAFQEDSDSIQSNFTFDSAKAKPISV
jgi:predicted glycosyltransferase